MNPVKLFEQPVTKQALTDYANEIANQVQEGNIDPLRALTSLNAIQSICADARKQIMDDVVDEFEKHGSKEVTVMGGAVLTKKETGVKYDYSNNEIWSRIKEREDVIATERKTLEKQLKTFTKPGMMSVDDELVEVNPPIRTSTTQIVVTIR